MRNKSGKNRLCTGLAPGAGSIPAITLLETVIALAIITIIFAAVLPQFRVINNSWDTKQGNAEVLQNGRVFTDHINHNISKAVKITAVSNSTETNGYIQFLDNDGNNLRYEVADSYVQFGAVGSLSDLAGPVSQLRFSCYDACDLDTSLDISTADVNDIRLVKTETILTNSASLSQNKTFTAYAYLRTNGNASSGSSTQTSYDYSNRTQGTNIFAYDGQGSPKAPNSATTPSDIFSSGEYDDIEYDDSTFHTFNASSNGKYAQMRFVFYIDENESDVTQIEITWNGKGINAHSPRRDGASLYIWNYNSSGYDLLQASADTEEEVTLTGTLTSSIANYIGGEDEDTITLFAVSYDKRTSHKDNELFTDYIKLEITTSSGDNEILP